MIRRASEIDLDGMTGYIIRHDLQRHGMTSYIAFDSKNTNRVAVIQLWSRRGEI